MDATAAGIRRPTAEGGARAARTTDLPPEAAVGRRRGVHHTVRADGSHQSRRWDILLDVTTPKLAVSSGPAGARRHLEHAAPRFQQSGAVPWPARRHVRALAGVPGWWAAVRGFSPCTARSARGHTGLAPAGRPGDRRA